MIILDHQPGMMEAADLIARRDYLHLYIVFLAVSP